MFGVNAIRSYVRGYKLISGTGDGGHGPEFPQGIREMDMMVVERGWGDASEHTKRVQVVLAVSNAFERENPDIETIDIPPHMWAMAVFMLCLGSMNEENFGPASEIAAFYGIKHGCNDQEIMWSQDWASLQMNRRRLAKAGVRS